MGNANIEALYAGSLGIKISYFFLRNYTVYKWCVTKVAHCTVLKTDAVQWRSQNAEKVTHIKGRLLDQ